MKKLKIGLLLFSDAEVLDFAGPFEVFSAASEINGGHLFDVFTVSETDEPIPAANGLSLNSNYTISNAPLIDILIIPGGTGTRKLIENKTVLNWVLNVHKKTQLTISICSGARVLAKLGLLNNKIFCTHKDVYTNILEIAPTAIPKPNLRYVSDGKIYTSGGISAGIDLSFHLLEHLTNKEIANATASYMEYNIVIC